MDDVRIEACTKDNLAEWLALREELWPDTAAPEHRREGEVLVGSPAARGGFLARVAGRAAGFAELALRGDYVNGCATSPVAFLEGIYVRPAARRRGIARLLCKAAEGWAVERGCAEIASDVELHNIASQRMHAALDFEETERVVFFRKPLRV